MADLTVAEIAERLAGNAEALCHELLPNGRREGAEWRVGNVNGDPGKSLAVHLAGPKAGVWTDFADGGTGGGDLLDLIEAVQGCDKADAVQWAKDWLGLNDGAPSPKPGKAKPEWTPILPIPQDAPRRLPPHRLGTPTSKWPYRDANAQLLFIVCRFDHDGGKDFLPLTYCRAPDGRCEWRWHALSAPRPLYGLDRLAQRPDAPVLIAEGEKATDAAQGYFPDHVALTWPGGTNAVAQADWMPLKGRAVVVCWPDADEQGAKAAQAVARAGHGAGASDVRIVELPPGLPKGWDLADTLPEDWTAETLRGLIEKAKPVEPGQSASREDDWPEPDRSILDGGLPPPPLPLDVFGPFWAHWIKTHAERVSVPVDYVAAPLLSVAAAAIGNARAASPWPGWVEPVILWLAKIGTPSSGKTPSDEPVLGMVSRLEKELAAHFDETLRRHETDLLSAKLAKEAWEKEVRGAVEAGQPAPVMPEIAATPQKPSRPRIKVADTTPEAMGLLLASHLKGLLFHRDELSGWLGAFDKYGGAGSDRAFWAECYNGSFFVIDRVKHPEPIRIPHLNASVLGGIQPDRLASLLLTGDDDGLPARFLMVWPEPLPPKRPTITVNNDLAYEALKRLHGLEMGVGEDGTPTRIVAEMTAEAADIFQEWRVEHFENQPPAGLFASHYGKLPGVVLRLALVLEHLWWAASDNPEPPTAITTKATAAAAGLVTDYFLPMARRAYGDAALPEDERGARTIGRWILSEGIEALNASELRRKVKLPGLRVSSSVNAALNYLEDANWIRAAPSREGNTKGRARSDYVVNPKARESMQ